MSWSKFGDTFMEQEHVELLSNDALVLYFAIVLYAGRQDADGRVPRTIARRLRDVPEVDVCLTELLSAGLIEELDAVSYHLPKWTEHHLSREKVEETREANAKRQENYRKSVKERRESGYWKQQDGDAPSSNAVTNGVSNGVTNGVSNSLHTRPDQTRPGTKGGSVSGGSGQLPNPVPAVQSAAQGSTTPTVPASRPAPVVERWDIDTSHVVVRRKSDQLHRTDGGSDGTA